LGARKLIVPKFRTEAEEAAWWYANRKKHAASLPDDMKRVSIDDLKKRIAERSVTKPITIRLPEEDLSRARKLAAEKGIGYQTYLKMLIHEGLKSRRSSS
jgi:predicted DNA binding CopG/RHH family protein